MSHAPVLPATPLARLAALRRFEASPPEFWAGFLSAAGEEVRAIVAELLTPAPAPAPAEGAAAAPNAWAARIRWQAGRHRPPTVAVHLLGPLCAEALTHGSSVAPDIAAGLSVGCLRLETGDPAAPAVAAFFFPDAGADWVREAIGRLFLAADVPLSYLQHQAAAKARADLGAVSSALDLLALLNREDRFLPSAMLVCNEMAARLQARRVSLGWLENNQARLIAMSHSEKFESKMEAVRLLELAMEECLDQECELVWPPADARTITRDHGIYAREIKAAALASAPLRVAGACVGGLLAEREEPFSPADWNLLRLHADQVARRLDDLRARDRWWGARLAVYARARAGKLVGIDHTWWKVAGVAGALILAGLLFLGKTYHVEAPFLVRSADVLHVTAPFDGYVVDVFAEPGDDLASGALLCRFDTSDLLQEQAIATANLARHRREVERARAAQAFADMLIHEARVEQTLAELERIRFRLGRAEVRVPFDATVLEGDLKQMLGAPVSAGNVLYQIARLDNLYVEVRVPEADIHFVRNGAQARLAFASLPAEKFPASVDRIEPLGAEGPGGTYFAARLEFPVAQAEWQRPGMGGVAKIEVGHRSFAYILTRRTLDYFRLNWWW